MEKHKLMVDQKKVVAVLVTVTLLLAHVVSVSATGQTEAVTAAEVVGEREAPMLAERVARGELPPVDERLPLEPKVLEPLHEIGRYGGTWRIGHVGATVWANEFSGIQGKPNLLSFAMEDNSVIANVAKDWEVIDGGKEIILYLREGMRWSDGHPFTADDILFWYEDILQETALTPSVPPHWRVKGQIIQIEKIDDYVIRFNFNGELHPHFPAILALRGEDPVRAPRHFFEELHPRYADATELEQRTKDAGFTEWWQLFNSYFNTTSWFRPDRHPDVPSLYAYVIVDRAPGVVFLERNPYYYKVDSAGNQLPYICKARVENVANSEVLEAMTIAGQIDYHRGFVPNLSVYVAHQESANLNILMWTDPQGARVNVALNHTHQDPVMRELINTPRFKHALSLAIDREEMNDLIWLGLGEPRQFSLLPPSPYYREEFARAYAEYDPDEAIRILREDVGLTRDSEGYWLRPDGQRLRIEIEVEPDQDDWVQGSELIADYWSAIGVDAVSRVRSAELHQELFAANRTDSRLWGDRVPPTSVYYNVESNFVPEMVTRPGIAWFHWWQSGGDRGMEPPEVVKQNTRWREVWYHDPDPDVRVEALMNMMAAQAEQLWRIGTVGNTANPMVVSADLRNAPQDGVFYAWDFAFIGHGRPETWYYASAERRAD